MGSCYSCLSDFHEVLESLVLQVNIFNAKFQDDAPVLGCLGRTGNVILLGPSREDRQHALGLFLACRALGRSPGALDE